MQNEIASLLDAFCVTMNIIHEIIVKKIMFQKSLTEKFNFYEWKLWKNDYEVFIFNFNYNCEKCLSWLWFYDVKYVLVFQHW